MKDIAIITHKIKTVFKTDGIYYWLAPFLVPVYLFPVSITCDRNRRLSSLSLSTIHCWYTNSEVVTIDKLFLVVMLEDDDHFYHYCCRCCCYCRNRDYQAEKWVCKLGYLCHSSSPQVLVIYRVRSITMHCKCNVSHNSNNNLAHGNIKLTLMSVLRCSVHAYYHESINYLLEITTVTKI